MQQQAQHQMMGYDRTSAMFSPDGRLLQVEYAKKTVKRGTVGIGIVYKDGVLFVADKWINDKLIVNSSVEKIFEIDEHIGATAVGFVMDGRILIEKAQLLAQQHRVTYDAPLDVLTLTKEICNMKQFYTQYGGARPFGVSLLIGAVNQEPELYVTDPAGIFFKYKATAVGENETEIKEVLEKEYKESMSREQALALAIKALKAVLTKDFDINRIDAASIDMENKKFTRIERNIINKVK
ncbi:archaeal proteasome endopeptidase complex subunit alpha [Candidatus Woesearchaeota archaeon]|nr:archaeal proteasome endopeptidase complex subunit alpha [Candidatus Woesearchaeota archaeon]